MSKAVATKIIGLGEFKAQLARISGSVRGAMLANAGTAGLQLVVNAAIPKAPKRTGTLRRSIHTETLTQTDNSAEIAVGTDVEYAAIQEFGGVVHQTNAWGKGIVTNITIPPHPYLRPAWDENIEKVITEVKASLIDLIKAAV
jgi:HK97 gp10 family phage protein